MRQLGRFLRLERARQENERPATVAPNRFATIEEASDAGASPSPGSHVVAHLERFVPEPDEPVVLDADNAEQPFVRCLRCGADSSRHSAVCVNCEARLDTAENREFNERLWASATAERQREAEQLRQLQQLRQAESEGATAAPGSQDAAELAARARAKLALEELEGAGARTWLHPWRNSVLGGPWAFVALGLGLPGLFLAVSHRSAVGVLICVGLASLLLAAVRRAP